MNRKSTILWRFAVLGLFVSLAPLGIYAIDKHDEIDTNRMLDVSVSIRIMSHVTVDNFGDSVWEISNGSGFLVSTSGCEVWTNHHVIDKAALIEVFPRGWKGAAGIPATIVNSTPRSDIAILRLEHCEDIPAAVLGNSARVKPGDETFAVGNPLGRNPDSISRGIISHTERYRESSTSYLQTDAAINPGNSGGALFDRDGKVIGVNTAIDTTAFGTNVGVGFAVPINTVMRAVSELRQGPPSWGDAGLSGIVSSLSPDQATVFNVPNNGGALVITRTPEQGPSAGKLMEHDIVYQVNKIPVVNMEQVVRMIGQQHVGEDVEMHLIRDSERKTVEITLGEGWKAAEKPQPDEYVGYLGMTLEMWDADEGDRARFKRPVITKVHSLGPAHKAHVASSQKTIALNGPYVIPYLIDVKTVTGVAYQGEFHEISTVDELETFASKAYKAKQPLLLEVEIWARSNPRDHKTRLELTSTTFYKLLPEQAETYLSNPELQKLLGRGLTRQGPSDPVAKPESGAKPADFVKFTG